MSLQLFRILEDAIIITADSMFATNTIGSLILSVVTGTPVPLPNNQNLSSFTANGANNTFTVPATGRYLITYHVNTSVSLLVGTRLMLNGSTPIPGTIISAALSKNVFSNTSIISLNQGNTITLQIFGLLGAVTLLGGGSTGASLAIVRLT